MGIGILDDFNVYTFSETRFLKKTGFLYRNPVFEKNRVSLEVK
jgi:hypothetical protein